MAMAPFFDTNVLIYLLLGEQTKRERAKFLVGQGGYLSVQVLNEFVAVSRRKTELSWPVILRTLDIFRQFCEVEPITLEAHELTLRIAQRYRFHIFDAQLLASALLAGCESFYSEDLQDGQLIEERLRIVNPFRSVPGVD